MWKSIKSFDFVTGASLVQRKDSVECTAMKPVLNQSQQHNKTVTCQWYSIDRTKFKWIVKVLQ